MKNIFRISLLAIVLGVGFTSCTAEALDEDGTVETVATDLKNEDPTPPTPPNG